MIWIETKDGTSQAIDKMLAQIVFTALQVYEKIKRGKSKISFPPYLGCFDNEKDAIIEKYTISSLITGEDIINLEPQASNLDNDTIKIIK